MRHFILIEARSSSLFCSCKLAATLRCFMWPFSETLSYRNGLSGVKDGGYFYDRAGLMHRCDVLLVYCTTAFEFEFRSVAVCQ